MLIIFTIMMYDISLLSIVYCNYFVYYNCVYIIVIEIEFFFKKKNLKCIYIFILYCIVNNIEYLIDL